MGLDPTRVDAVLVDSYSTLVDVTSTADALEPYVSVPLAVARLWQLRSREYAVVGNAVGVYRPATERHRLALAYALDVHDADLTDAEREDVLAAYHDLDVYDDVRAALARVQEAGLSVSIVSNGDPDLLASLVRTAGLESIVAETISADEVRTYKPARSFYEHAAARVGHQPGNLLLVSASWSDVNGGINAGMQTAWLNRKDRDWEPYARDPDVVLDGLHGLADRLQGAA